MYKKGLHLTPEKVCAIMEGPTPRNRNPYKTPLFLHKFFLSLSSKMNPLSSVTETSSKTVSISGGYLFH